MKETRYKADPRQPYGLHDCRMNGMRIRGGNLELSFENDFFRIAELGRPGTEVRGHIVIEGIDRDFCSVLICGKRNRAGEFRGELLSVEDFIGKYPEFGFEITEEYYGWHRLQYSGFLWMPDEAPREMTVSLGYFTGDVVFFTEE